MIEGGKFLAAQNGQLVQGGQGYMVVNQGNNLEILYQECQEIRYYSLNEP